MCCCPVRILSWGRRRRAKGTGGSAFRFLDNPDPTGLIPGRNTPTPPLRSRPALSLDADAKIESSRSEKPREAVTEEHPSYRLIAVDGYMICWASPVRVPVTLSRLTTVGKVGNPYIACFRSEKIALPPIADTRMEVDLNGICRAQRAGASNLELRRSSTIKSNLSVTRAAAGQSGVGKLQRTERAGAPLLPHYSRVTRIVKYGDERG